MPTTVEVPPVGSGTDDGADRVVIKALNIDGVTGRWPTGGGRGRQLSAGPIFFGAT